MSLTARDTLLFDCGAMTNINELGMVFPMPMAAHPTFEGAVIEI